MEYRNQGDEIGIPNSTIGYNHPPPGRGSAFSKPTFSTSSSLLSPRAAAAAAGGAPAGGGGIGGNRNGHHIIASNTTPPPPPPPPLAAVPPAPASTTTPAVLTHISTPIDNHSSSSSQPFGNLISDPAPVSNSSLSTPAAGAGGILSNSKPSTATPIAKPPNASTAAADVSCRYRECLRNHAASVGGHVVDGCGEFMPNGDPSTHEFLKCAACGCHRSFHRKEPDAGESNAVGSGKSYYPSARLPLLLPPPHPQSPHAPKHFHIGGSAGAGFPPSPSPRAAAPAGSSVVVAFGGNTSGSGGTTTESSSEERFHRAGATPAPAAAGSRKRFRTKFTLEQKEKMLAFAERIGWRIQKQDEAAVQQFCADAGVRRQVLKVWMHNNKNTIKKQEQQQQPSEHDQLLPQQHHQQQS